MFSVCCKIKECVNSFYSENALTALKECYNMNKSFENMTICILDLQSNNSIIVQDGMIKYIEG